MWPSDAINTPAVLNKREIVVKVKRGKGQGVLAEGERHKRQAVITRVGKSRSKHDRHQNRAFEVQGLAEEKSKQPDDKTKELYSPW